jgi:hypothetical protein
MVTLLAQLPCSSAEKQTARGRLPGSGGIGRAGVSLCLTIKRVREKISKIESATHSLATTPAGKPSY